MRFRKKLNTWLPVNGNQLCFFINLEQIETFFSHYVESKNRNLIVYNKWLKLLTFNIWHKKCTKKLKMIDLDTCMYSFIAPLALLCSRYIQPTYDYFLDTCFLFSPFIKKNYHINYNQHKGSNWKYSFLSMAVAGQHLHYKWTLFKAKERRRSLKWHVYWHRVWWKTVLYWHKMSKVWCYMLSVVSEGSQTSGNIIQENRFMFDREATVSQLFCCLKTKHIRN